MSNFQQTVSSPTTKSIIAVIVFSFLATFVIARLVVYLVLGHWMPDLFLTIKGVHIHHFTYGVVILVLVGLVMLLLRPAVNSRAFNWCALFYGIGLGLTFDEFGMWIRLQDNYWIRQSYDAVVVVALLLLNIAYYKSVLSILSLRWLRDNFKSNVDTDSINEYARIGIRENHGGGADSERR